MMQTFRHLLAAATAALLLMISVAISPAQAVTTYTYDSTFPTLKEGQRPIILSTASRRICYKYEYGNFIFTHDPTWEPLSIGVYQCDNVEYCQGQCWFRANITAGDPSKSFFEGATKYNFTGVFANVNQYASLTQYTESPCVESSVARVYHWPAASDVCLPGRYYEESEHIYVLSGQVVYTRYSNLVCDASNIRTTYSYNNNSCFSLFKYHYQSGSGHQMVVIWKSGAGRHTVMMSAFVMLLLAVVVVML